MLLAACGTSGSSGSSGGSGSATVNKLEIMAPADPGGGWDQTARSVQQSLTDAKLVRNVQVSNVGGAGGTVGLAKLASERSEDYLMVTGLVMVGAVETNKSAHRLEQVTPIARLTAEDEIIVVPAGSPYQKIDDLVADVAAKGQAVSITGGSAGGTDHILAGMMLQAKGIPADKLNYIPYSGGGESLAALLGNKVSAGISGIGEYREQIKAGKLRALATSGPDAHADLGAPTLKQAGLDVELINWRGIVAPPGISADAKARLIKLATDMHGSQAWKDTLTQKGWTDTFVAGDEFGRFLTAEVSRIKPVLQQIGIMK
jgi:putative tricarboxylic transport membrane protein